MKKLLIALITLLLVAPSAFAEKTVKDGAVEVGHDFKTFGKSVGDAAKRDGKAVGNAFREAGKATGKAFRELGREIKADFTKK